MKKRKKMSQNRNKPKEDDGFKKHDGPEWEDESK